MFLLSPRFVLSRIFFKALVKLTGADKSFNIIFQTIFANTPQLVLNYGITPVFRVMWTLRRFINKGIKFKDLPKEMYGER